MTVKHDASHYSMAGWKSVIQLCREGAPRSSHAMKVKVEMLRERLIDSLMSEGASESAAKDRVAREFICQKGPGLYVSPKAIPLLDVRIPPPRAPSSWRSAEQLVRTRELRGSRLDLSSKINTMRSNISEEIIEQLGIKPEEAEILVDHSLVGTRRTGFRDKEAFYVSPDALRWLKDEGTVSPPGTRTKSGRSSQKR